MDAHSENRSKVAIIIVTFNADEFVKLCLDSVARYATMPHEVIVVDNASEPPLRDMLRARRDIRLILNDENILWCAANNQGIRAASDDVTHYLLLNSDMEVRRADWLQRMVNVAESNPRIGIVGTQLLCKRIWPSFGGVDGQCMLIKRSLVDRIGLLDCERFPWNGADIEYATRAFKHGFIFKVLPDKPKLVVHYYGMSWRRASDAHAEGRRLYRKYNWVKEIRGMGLPAWRIPKILWSLYTRLPGRPFFELTDREHNIARGLLNPNRRRKK